MRRFSAAFYDRYAAPSLVKVSSSARSGSGAQGAGLAVERGSGRLQVACHRYRGLPAFYEPTGTADLTVGDDPRPTAQVDDTPPSRR